MTINNWKSRGLIAGGIVLVLWAAVTLGVHSNSVAAEGDRVFEIHVYHVAPGKMPAMEARFRDKISKLLARHNLNVIGYWVADEPSDYTFVFMVAHANAEE